ncbi:hypothetical protein DSD19_06490 [Rhodovulum sp. BSW8]|uniref:Uncharacterized protein n=1 Tax=Rhodovulum visakhapatnamense TaxID=364297 RepID=A0A4R8G3M7_9RHOB|nr:hypothetical protein [Rhodovulum]RBO53914.1 hypothetical protein DSD19_06490 [Rhodovulum sp. BSW8]TDX29706.1 hypothetical protein EV657_108128 [Rhodovulum visakhapatnamense]
MKLFAPIALGTALVLAALPDPALAQNQSMSAGTQAGSHGTLRATPGSGPRVSVGTGFAIIDMGTESRSFCCDGCSSDPGGPGGVSCSGCTEVGPVSCSGTLVTCADDLSGCPVE